LQLDHSINSVLNDILFVTCVYTLSPVHQGLSDFDKIWLIDAVRPS